MGRGKKSKKKKSKAKKSQTKSTPKAKSVSTSKSETRAPRPKTESAKTFDSIPAKVETATKPSEEPATDWGDLFAAIVVKVLYPFFDGPPGFRRTLGGFGCLLSGLGVSSLAYGPGKIIWNDFEKEWGWVVIYFFLAAMSLLSGLFGIRLIIKNAAPTRFSKAWRIILMLACVVGMTLFIAFKYSREYSCAVPGAFVIMVTCYFASEKRWEAIEAKKT